MAKKNPTMEQRAESTLFSQRVAELERMYRMVNDLFASKGEKICVPVFITIAPKGKRNCYGWCVVKENWFDSKGNAMAYEINIASETLGREISKTFETMVHEMVHLWNAERGIQDCAKRSDRHNENFKKGSDFIGLHCEKVEDRRGYATCDFPITQSSEELQALLEEYKATGDYKLLDVSRQEEISKKKTKKASNQIKFVCPNCGNSVRATKLLRVACYDCSEEDGRIVEMLAE